MSDWWNYERTVRRAAKGGVRARSQRGEIGEKWWSRRFVAALEAISDSSRLSRGRSYARSGQVMDPEVRPGLIAARVQGSRAAPYAVRIEIDPFGDAEWERAAEAMASQALFLAALLAGEVPRDIEDAFTAAGLSLFPRSPGELRTSCSCPDWANPCKHVAAALYILAERFDDDPFLIFAWRGRDQDELIGRLRHCRTGADARTSPDRGLPDDEPDGLPLGTNLARFWNAGPGLEQLHFAPRAAPVPDATLRQLGPLDAEVRGKPALEWLAPAYETITRAAELRALGER